MTLQERLKLIVETLDAKKAEEIKAIEVKDLTIIADYFVIATGTSSTQVKALADEVDFVLSEKGVRPRKIEGYQGANWIVLDYEDIVVHVFYAETRRFYSLERLWSDGMNVDIQQLIK